MQEAAAIVYERQAPETITKDQMDTALAGLSVLIRTHVQEELTRAQLDTSIEYHRAHDPTVQAQLWGEIQCLNFVIASCKRVDNEFREIVAGA